MVTGSSSGKQWCEVETELLRDIDTLFAFQRLFSTFLGILTWTSDIRKVKMSIWRDLNWILYIPHLLLFLKWKCRFSNFAQCKEELSYHGRNAGSVVSLINTLDPFLAELRKISGIGKISGYPARASTNVAPWFRRMDDVEGENRREEGGGKQNGVGAHMRLCTNEVAAAVVDYGTNHYHASGDGDESDGDLRDF